MIDTQKIPQNHQRNLRGIWFFLVAVMAILLTNLVVLLNIPFLRQIFGFLFLTILPGLLIIQMLKLDKISLLEKFILSWGVSITFLLLFGLLLNNLALSLSYSTPLSVTSILISFDIIFIVLLIIGYKMHNNLIFVLPNPNLTASEKAFLIIPILFPVLSILGTHLMKTTDNNIVLMFLLILIPAYVAFVCFFNQKFPKRFYPVVIFLISISLLLIFMLRFPHICGHDVHTEYGYYFQTTFDNLHWSVFGHTTLDACLSISLLPTVFQSILNVHSQEYLFKGVYVSICSFSPLIIYIISKKYVSELYAFLASFFFMMQAAFLNIAGNPRTNVAIFFVALAIMVFFNNKIAPSKRRLLFILFLLSIVVSHYSTTYIFLFVMFFSWFAVELLLKRLSFKKSITLKILLLFSVVIFLWYSQVTETAFNAGVTFISDTIGDLDRFFIVESRAPEYKQLVGTELAHPILSRVNWVVTWCVFIFIGIGVLTMLRRYKEMVSLSKIKSKKPNFLKNKFEMEYLVMSSVCSGILMGMVILPHISIGYGMQRLYSLATVILSVCFVIGGMTLSKKFLFIRQIFKNGLTKNAKHNHFRQVDSEKNLLQVGTYLIILSVLVPYFMFTTGVMYEIFDVRGPITLNSEGDMFDFEYVRDSESYAAKWPRGHTEDIRWGEMCLDGGLEVNTPDQFSTNKMISQGKIPPKKVTHYYFTQHLKRKEMYIYLSYPNVVNNILVVNDVICNISEYSDMFIEKSNIYDSGGSEIWK